MWDRWILRRIAIVLLCALLAAATAAALLWAGDVHVDNQVAQARADLETHDTDLQGRLVSAEASTQTLTQDRIALRLAYDPSITSAVASVTTSAATTACTQATDAVNAGQGPPPVEAAVQGSVTGAEATYPALSEVPGWQAHVDTAAVTAKASECKAAAEAAKKAAQKKAQTGSNSGTLVGGKDMSKYLCENNNNADSCIGMSDIRHMQEAKRGHCPAGLTCDKNGNLIGG